MTGEDQQFVLVLTSDVLEFIRNDPDPARLHREMLATGQGEMYHYDGEITSPAIIADETVHLGLTDDEGMVQALTTTDDTEALKWAESTFDAHRVRAKVVTETDLK